MLIYPAIDLREGRVVRLTQGDYDRMTVYGDDPAEMAEGFVRAGATCLHAVDLDGAKDGSPKNRAVIAELCKKPLLIEVGGGIRTQEDIEQTLALGVSRVILGTVAVTDFDFTARMGRVYGDRLAVGVDAKDGFVAIHGWKTVTETHSFDFCRKLLDVGIRTVIYTDIGRDGLLSGANLPAYGQLQQIQGLQVIASGGISFEAEIAALRDLGLYGAIVGKALYAGKLSLPRILKIARGEEVEC
ncbi:MAG TPA: 1-(5-phosphoribosyl)-5-[(5-phosphoribosylamino)methylideneamino]imidazole-4-carboxamide isomerase [Candidatus Limiplasma sp.]|nr:1-(5-phosphoribosyl)-5-[(5-phosphoribosylamino)methylideneamino]imidazole-4-carboxamide isomerase [Candidatus Limiplasma sp.]HPS80874.1 1-(5-phosphoribosyl)-5-[(5-phosphoribosylamino)methylideneamino]imidazole-4-carboxamide isomerase [Candidatus Limiplasma sp.]